MKKVWMWCKQEAVLVIACVLAVASAFVVHSDKQYIHCVADYFGRAC